jgi:hypothetical protein
LLGDTNQGFGLQNIAIFGTTKIWTYKADMTQEIESVKPALTVILDDGDFIINSTGPIGKLMAQAILPAAAAARKVTIITDGEMKVMKRNGDWPAKGAPAGAVKPPLGDPNTHALDYGLASHQSAKVKAYAGELDIQDQFAADLEAGRTGEIATGEAPAPTPGPSDPVKIPARRKPQIFQDAAAPPAPELAEAEMDRLLQEAAQAERDAVKAAEDMRFQRQQAVQDGQDQTDPDTPTETTKPATRKREPRNLATTGKACGRCGGGGQIMGDSGHTGACPVCMGAGQIKSWVRSR